MIQFFFHKINKSKNKKGFTLIELIVVIAILGILAFIAVPRFSSISSDAQEKADETTARIILSAISMAEAKYGVATSITDAHINEFLNEPISIANAASAEKTWVAQYDGTANQWKIHKWNTKESPAASKQILP